MDKWNAKNLKEFTVNAARKLAKEKGYDRLIVIYTKEGGSEYEYGVTTYGRTKDLCKKTAKIGGELGKGLEYFLHKETKE